jgi:hypothetical protein
MKLRLDPNGEWIVASTSARPRGLRLAVDVHPNMLFAQCLLEVQLDSAGVKHYLERHNGDAVWSVRTYGGFKANHFEAKLYQWSPPSENGMCDVSFIRRIWTGR